MFDSFQRIATFIEPIGITIVLVYLYGVFGRKLSSNNQIELCMGLLFGLAAMIAMSSPIEVAEGRIIDLRNLFVGVSAAFFGWRGGAVTVVMALLTRAYIGGDGAAIGILAIGIAATMGALWAYAVRPKVPNDLVAVPILGAMISVHILPTVFLPADLRWFVFTEIVPVLIVLNFVGSAMLALLIYREQALAGEATRLLQAATTDPLTRLLNRSSAMEAYRKRNIQHGANRGCAMACIDIDNFKQINDTHGHQMGDSVLVELTKRMQECLRPDDIFCRMGGDEFLIALDNVASHEAKAIAERCRNNVVRADFEKSGMHASPTISVGIVWAPAAQDFATFRSAADDALYHAKALGRDCVAFVDYHAPDSPVVGKTSVSIP